MKNYANLRNDALKRHTKVVADAFLEGLDLNCPKVKESEARLSRDLKAVDAMETCDAITTPECGLALDVMTNGPIAQNGRTLFDNRNVSPWSR